MHGLSYDRFWIGLRPMVFGCNASATHVYRRDHVCRNQARFFVPEIGLRFCQYHLGDILYLLDLESYTLHRLDW